MSLWVLLSYFEGQLIFHRTVVWVQLLLLTVVYGAIWSNTYLESEECDLESEECDLGRGVIADTVQSTVAIGGLVGCFEG
jgi:hypothetical protein